MSSPEAKIWEHYQILCMRNTFQGFSQPTIYKQTLSSTFLFDHTYPRKGRNIRRAWWFAFVNFFFCNYICLRRATGYMDVNKALRWSGFSGRIRGSGIIRVVETSENDWNDFVLTWLYFRLIVMWLGIGIRIAWVQQELQKRVKYSVYH